MTAMTVFGLDTVAWLAEHRRANATLIQSASVSTPRVTREAERPAPALQGELACC